MSRSSVPSLAKAITEATQDLKTAETQDHLRVRIRSVDTELQTVITELEGIRDLRTECAEVGLPILPAAGAGDLVARIAELSVVADSDPVQVTDAPDLPGVLKRLRATVAKAQEGARQDWLSHCQTAIPTTQPEYLSLLATRQGNRRAVERLRSIDRELDVIKQQDPLSTRGLPGRLHSLIEERRELWAGLEVGDVPEEVMEFIGNASRDGAALLDLTPEVMKWLMDNQMLTAYKIVPA